MKYLAAVCAAIIVLMCFLDGIQDSGGVYAWPVAKPEVVIIELFFCVLIR